jgi:hypothetical protein
MAIPFPDALAEVKKQAKIRNPNIEIRNNFEIYSERLFRVVIARSEATWQSHLIASLRSQ